MKMKVHRKTVQQRWSTEIKVLQKNPQTKHLIQIFILKRCMNLSSFLFQLKTKEIIYMKIKFTKMLYIFYTFYIII